MSAPRHFHRDSMRGIVNRARDIVSIARVVHTENPDLDVVTCVRVVTTAVYDLNADILEEAVLDVGEAIDELRKRLT